MKQKDFILVNHDNNIATRKNPTLNSGIYITAYKVAQCSMVVDNRRLKKKVKKETSNNIAARKVFLQRDKSEAVHKFQDCMGKYHFLIKKPCSLLFFALFKHPQGRLFPPWR